MSFGVKTFSLGASSLFFLLGLYLSISQNEASAFSIRELDSQAVAQSFSRSSLEAEKLRADALYQSGEENVRNDNYELALEQFRASLLIYEFLGDYSGIAKSLYSIGRIYQRQDFYEQAIEILQQAVSISREIGDLNTERLSLNNLGLSYRNLGEYAQAVSYHEQALEIARTLNRPLYEQAALNNLGSIYVLLGQYNEALKLYEMALALNQLDNTPLDEIYQSRRSRFITLHGLGWAYDHLGEYDLAIANYQQALLIEIEIRSRSGEAQTLNNLGNLYFRMGNLEQALSFLTESLKILEELNDREQLTYTLDSLGEVYSRLGDLEQAWETYQNALSFATELRQLPQLRVILSSIGDLLVQQNQPELAIVFYKRSVNITEEIRRGIQGLPIEQQQSYTNTIADTYRKLAALLIQQDRILEAQQVLDLLKVQEIQDYLRRGVRGTEQTSQGVYLWEAEQRVFASFEALLQEGQRLAELRTIPAEELTPEQQTELIELDRKSRQIQATFNRFVDLPDVQAALQRLRLNASQTFDLNQIGQLRSNLSQLRPDAVLLYPLVLDDRLELVVLSPNLEPLHKTVNVTRTELNQTISDFLRDLQNPESDSKPNAAKLYEWLIRPIEGFLQESGAKVVLYAPDRQLRYIPLAALYDGQQWFVENYQVNHITAISLTNLNTPPRSNPRILAGAFSEGRHLVARRGESPIPFGGLPFAKVEVQTIARLFPGTRQLINQDFTEASTLPFLNSYNIVHFATHALFTTGSPEDSFIVMGNGDTIDLSEIRTLSLGNVDLMVLSGCQTAVSTINLGQELGEGTEILGFGYQVQSAGARATIASLWSVDDGGTEALMSQFYALLQQGNRPKAETLQQAQIALIQGEENVRLQDALIRDRSAGNLPRISPEQLIHPYYWAPFILIGNGL